jgi:hypothetical protein
MKDTLTILFVFICSCFVRGGPSTTEGFSSTRICKSAAKVRLSEKNTKLNKEKMKWRIEKTKSIMKKRGIRQEK